jgi:hypothetical protein
MGGWRGSVGVNRGWLGKNWKGGIFQGHIKEAEELSRAYWMERVNKE